MTRRDKRRVYAVLVIVVGALFAAGFVAGYVSRNDKICSDGKPPVRQRPDVLLGHTVYQCHNGEMVTK